MIYSSTCRNNIPASLLSWKQSSLVAVSKTHKSGCYIWVYIELTWWTRRLSTECYVFLVSYSWYMVAVAAYSLAAIAWFWYQPWWTLSCRCYCYSSDTSKCHGGKWHCCDCGTIKCPIWGFGSWSHCYSLSNTWNSKWEYAMPFILLMTILTWWVTLPVWSSLIFKL